MFKSDGKQSNFFYKPLAIYRFTIETCSQVLKVRKFRLFTVTLFQVLNAAWGGVWKVAVQPRIGSGDSRLKILFLCAKVELITIFRFCTYVRQVAHIFQPFHVLLGLKVNNAISSFYAPFNRIKRRQWSWCVAMRGGKPRGILTLAWNVDMTATKLFENIFYWYPIICIRHNYWTSPCFQTKISSQRFLFRSLMMTQHQAGAFLVPFWKLQLCYLCSVDDWVVGIFRNSAQLHK